MRSERDTGSGASIDYRQVFADLPSAAALVSRIEPEHRVFSASEGFAEQLGLGHAALEGLGLSEVFSASAVEHVRRAILECGLRGAPARRQIAQERGDEVVRIDVETRRVTDGVLLSLETPSPRPTLDQVGEAGVLDEIAPLLGGLVFIYDVAARSFRYAANPLALRLNLPVEALARTAVSKLVHPSDRAAFRRHLRQSLRLADRSIAEIVLRLKDSDGQWPWFAVRTRVLDRSFSGEPRRLMGVARDVTRDHEARQALADAALALAHAEFDERRRVGRELHDSTSQLLVAARLALTALERRHGLDEEAVSLVAGARSAISAAQDEIRNFSFLLHPPGLQETGLERSLEEFGAGFGRRTGLEIAIDFKDGPWSLPEAMEMALFRVAQEALMNVYRHAQAHRAVLRLFRDGALVVLEIEDDGVGLPAPPGAASIGVGISGMRARMVQLGGELTLMPGKAGLLVRASAPHAN